MLLLTVTGNRARERYGEYIHTLIDTQLYIKLNILYGNIQQAHGNYYHGLLVQLIIAVLHSLLLNNYRYVVHVSHQH